MKKDDAIKMIQESDCNNFTVICVYPKKVCDLCKKPRDREFTITAKHCYGHNEAGIKLRYPESRGRRITKHICTECFVKLFPEEKAE